MVAPVSRFDTAIDPIRLSSRIQKIALRPLEFTKHRTSPVLDPIS